MHTKFLLCVLLAALSTSAQTVVDITVKGISDTKNDGAQKDREEAILDAKRQACEKAGIAMESRTTVKDFKLLSDFVETQSKGVLLPGFQVVDVGYVADGTYQVVLSGKIKTRDEEVISAKELRYAKTLNDRQEYARCRSILAGFIDSRDEKVPEETKEEAHYLFMRWGYAHDLAGEFDKFSAYYPQSRRLDVLKSFAAFAQKPLCTYDRQLAIDFSRWQKRAVTREENTFDQAITAALDTLVFTDFANVEHSLVVEYLFLHSTAKDAKVVYAYDHSVRHCRGNLKKQSAKTRSDTLDTVFDSYKPYTDSENLKYQASRSNTQFGSFALGDCMLQGEVPTKKGTFAQKLTFTVRQMGF